jgi:hypothetical protein
MLVLIIGALVEFMSSRSAGGVLGNVLAPVALIVWTVLVHVLRVTGNKKALFVSVGMMMLVALSTHIGENSHE